MAEHPITPPPELVHQWHKEACKDPYNGGTFFESKTLKHIATQAARWGADQELEACLMEVEQMFCWGSARDLRAARRPKPPSLKEQALEALDLIPTHDNEGRTVGVDVSIIRRALEALPDD